MKLYRNTKSELGNWDKSPIYGYVDSKRNLQSGAYYSANKVRVQNYSYPLSLLWILTSVPNNTGVHDATT